MFKLEDVAMMYNFGRGGEFLIVKVVELGTDQTTEGEPSPKTRMIVKGAIPRRIRILIHCVTLFLIAGDSLHLLLRD